MLKDAIKLRGWTYKQVIKEAHINMCAKYLERMLMNGEVLDGYRLYALALALGIPYLEFMKAARKCLLRKYELQLIKEHKEEIRHYHKIHPKLGIRLTPKDIEKEFGMY